MQNFENTEVIYRNDTLYIKVIYRNNNEMLLKSVTAGGIETCFSCSIVYD